MTKKAVTIICGFLGSGKTTLLNKIVNSALKKFAIVENEFGEINIDSELISENNSGIFELSNGCICCNINAELEDVLVELNKSQYEYEHLLIEASGVADPIGVINSLMSDHLQTMYFIESVICIVDAANFITQIEQNDVLFKQIVASNLLILNKADLASSEMIREISSKIKQINPISEIIEAEFAEVSVEEIIGIKRFDPLNEDIFKSNNTAHNTHQINFNSVSLIVEVQYTTAQFQTMLNNLFNHYREDLYRFKGVFNPIDSDAPLIVQTVGDRITAAKSTKPKDTITKMVLIGKGLDKSEVEKIFQI